MQLFRSFVVGLIGAAIGMAADLPSQTVSLDSKLRTLEIRRIPNYEGSANSDMHAPRETPRQSYCRDTPRGAYCRLDHLVNWLAYAYGVNDYRISGPSWIFDDDLYLIGFEYHEGPLPVDLTVAAARDFVREAFPDRGDGAA